MKKCPYCAEQILDEAVKCRYCHEWLDESRRPAPPADDTLPWYFKTSFIVLMLLSIPPVALPLVWLRPKLHPLWKIAVTLAVVGSCWVAFIAVRGFISQFDEATKLWETGLQGL